MKKMPLNILDLVPKEATFKLSGEQHKGRVFTIKKWSLRVRAWAQEKYTSKGLQEIFAKQKIVEVCELAYFMLSDLDKEYFKDQDGFFDSINGIADEVTVFKALAQSIGIGEPELEKIDDHLKAEAAAGEAIPSPNE